MRSNLWKVLSLMICLMATACSSSDDENYPKTIDARDKSEHVLKDYVCQLKYSETREQWLLTPGGEFGRYPFQGGDETVCTVIVENMSDMWQQYAGKTVVVNGHYRHLYTEVYNPNVGPWDEVYSVRISEIKLE